MAKPARSKQASKPAPKPQVRRAAPANKKAAKPMRDRKLGAGVDDPPR